MSHGSADLAGASGAVSAFFMLGVSRDSFSCLVLQEVNECDSCFKTLIDVFGGPRDRSACFVFQDRLMCVCVTKRSRNV